jgi:hypothetical protein
MQRLKKWRKQKSVFTGKKLGGQISVPWTGFEVATLEFIYLSHETSESAPLNNNTEQILNGLHF